MKEVRMMGCDHTEMVDDDMKTMPGNKVMNFCSRCLAVQTPEDLFVGYPSGYLTQYGKRVAARIKEINGNAVIVATHLVSGIAYDEWTVQKSDFHKTGHMLTADPFNTIKN